MDGWREIWGAREVAEGLRQEGDRGGREEVRVKAGRREKSTEGNGKLWKK